MRTLTRLIPLILVLAVLATGQTAKFPTSIATDADLLKAYDRGASVLAGDIDASTLTIPVFNGSGFAGAVSFSITIDDERIRICSVSGNTLTACAGGRGFSGSGAAAHLAGAQVRATITAWHHNALAAEVKAVEGALGVNLTNVEKPLVFSTPLLRSTNTVSCPNCLVSTTPYSDPSWLTLTKGKVGLGNVENTALSTWPGSANLTTLGTLSQYVKAPKQINFSLWDSATSLLAGTIPGIWRAEYGGAALVSVACMADTAGTLIQIRKNTSMNMLAANLTCGNGIWASTSSFSVSALLQNDDIGLQILSGSAKRINVSIRYIQQ